MVTSELFLQLKQPLLVLNGAEGQSVQANSAAQQLLGISDPDLTKAPFWNPEIALQLNQPAVAGRKEIGFGGCRLCCEYSPISHPEGHCLVIMLSQPGSLTQDLQSFSHIIDSLGAYVYCKDNNYRYTFANHEVCELFGQPMSQIVGCTDDRFFGEQSARKLIEESDRQVIEGGQVIRREEIVYIPPLDEYRTYLTVKKPLYDQDGNINGLFGISTDISGQKLIQQQLYQSETKLTAILNNVGSCIFIKDRDCRFTYMNRKTEQVFGATADAVLGLTVLDILGAEGEEMYRTDRQVFEQGAAVKVLESFNAPQGEQHFWTEKVPMRNAEGELDAYIGIATDITDQVELERKLTDTNRVLQHQVAQVTQLTDRLHQQANRDPLTQLYNRRYLDASRQELIADASRRDQLTLLLIDMDHFKRINDELGHQTGDDVLQLLADVLQQGCRSSDLVCRYGGEEFIVAMPATTTEDARRKAEQLRHQYCQAAFALLPEGWHSTFSVGIASYPQHGENFEQVVKSADRALYRAKAEGRDRVVCAELVREE
ncbi:sensor domain-containing diguanylate cyclase [Marinobacterium jannaschii]|uniref:sensor domain-containing diguanylate cyclase n=1 Tax=Marinobacterium jannaschii TaxID=64970 RepID=UPI000A5D6E7B|nr:diguanylate cyclase [Marinobacterium jannaschii]